MEETNSDFWMPDIIILIKCDGTRVENIQASFDENEITIFDVSLRIEQQDTIERQLPNGMIETYKILDVVYQGEFLIPSHQRRARQVIKVRKTNAFQDESQPTTVHNYHNVQSVQHGSNNFAYNTQNFGSDAQELADLIAQMRTSIHDLDRPEEEKEEAQLMVDMLEEQAKVQPLNTSRIKVLAKSTASYLADKGVDLSVSLGGTVLGSMLLKSLHLT
jgi:hypothetical protein